MNLFPTFHPLTIKMMELCYDEEICFTLKNMRVDVIPEGTTFLRLEECDINPWIRLPYSVRHATLEFCTGAEYLIKDSLISLFLRDFDLPLEVVKAIEKCEGLLDLSLSVVKKLEEITLPTSLTTLLIRRVGKKVVDQIASLPYLRQIQAPERLDLKKVELKREVKIIRFPY